MSQLAEAQHTILVCSGGGCLSSGSQAVRDALQAAGSDATNVRVQGTGCLGLCSRGPLVMVQPGSRIYATVVPEQAGALLQAAEIAGGTRTGTAVASPAGTEGDVPPGAAVHQAPPAEGPAASGRETTMDTSAAAAEPGGTPASQSIPELTALPADMPFFTRQTRIVLSGAGRVDPEHIEDYIAAGGYQALAKALQEMTPSQVVEQIVRSGLRGRGGAGYPTGVKWGLVARAQAQQKYLICNGDEGDPGAFMDRSVMEGDPHRVLEGMTIAAYAVGASQGYIYVRGEYPIAIKRLQTAIRQAERRGVLGARVFETPFQFRIDLRIGAGAFVCGEETALIASVEGGRGVPRARPPYPAQSGVWGQPTLINNVETFASVAPIITHGGDWYAGFGTEKSKGTKVFALAGAINHTGLVEVPFGISLREVIFDIGGGIPGGHAFKAVQTGGPSGGCIPAEYLDSSLDYETLARLGSIVGSGGMIVMDDTSCMVDVARYFTDFCMRESCGKCIPCRAGTVQSFQILDRMTRGEATSADLSKLEQLCLYMRDASLCGLGQNAPNPIVSTLRSFRDEYLAHVEHKVCPAGVCPMRPEPLYEPQQSRTEVQL